MSQTNIEKQKEQHMIAQVQRILNKLYKFNNKYYGKDKEPLYSEEVLSENERNLLSANAWKLNDVEFFYGHDDKMEKIYSLKQHPLLTEERIIKAFIAGVGGSYLRGRSVLSAWHCLNTLPPHPYHEKVEYHCCWICGENDEVGIINNSEFQYIMHLGNAYSDNPKYAYLNLKYFLEQPIMSPTVEDMETFSKLFSLLRTAHPDETPGKFEKRVKEAKILPASQHVRGILHSLAMVGVVPNQFLSLSNKKWACWGEIVEYENRLKNTQGRSDMSMPWAGWLGRLKINETIADELFGKYFKADNE